MSLAHSPLPNSSPHTAAADPDLLVHSRAPVTLRLFVAGGTPQAASAIGMAARLRREHLEPQDRLEVIDVARNPEMAGSHGVIALPALVRADVRPHPVWVGNLFPFPPVLRAIGIAPRAASLRLPQAEPPAEAHEVSWDQPDAWIAEGPQGRVVAVQPGADAVFRELAQNPELGLAMLSASGLVLFANPRLSELLGIVPDQLLASTLWDHLLPQDAAALQERMASLHEAHVSDTVQCRAPDGRYQQLYLSLSPLHGRAGMHVGVVLQDMNTWRNVLARLESQQERLEVLVADRTHQLQQLLSQAEAGQRAKSVFLSKMSHEIRTPLNAILGFAHLLLREVKDPVQSDRLRKMEQAGRHLLTLLTDILGLARIEADRVDLHLARLDLAAITQRVQAMVADVAAAKGLRLVARPVPPMPAWLCGDAQRITQCLLNLAFNAVKFTERGQIEIHARLVHEGHDRAVLRFDVDDTGPGIPPAQAQRLFAQFEQGPANALHQQGSGLGLAITRGLARAMGGDCGMEPRPEGGSRFWFTVGLSRPRDGSAEPLSAAHVRPPAPPAGRPVPADDAIVADALQALKARHAGRWVLVVEDEPVNRDVAALLLQDAGLRVMAVGDGHAALQVLARHPEIALVLMDMQMPNLDGPATAREIRRDAGAATLPIVALTGNAFADDRQSCLQAGMNDFLAKPVDPHVLYRTVLRWLD